MRAGILTGLALLREVPWSVPITPLCVWAAGLLLPRLLTGRWWCISPATMAAAASAPIAVIVSRSPTPYTVLSVAMAGLILVRHKHNIRRLLAGAEPRLSNR